MAAPYSIEILHTDSANLSIASAPSGGVLVEGWLKSTGSIWTGFSINNGADYIHLDIGGESDITDFIMHLGAYVSYTDRGYVTTTSATVTSDQGYGWIWFAVQLVPGTSWTTRMWYRLGTAGSIVGPIESTFAAADYGLWTGACTGIDVGVAYNYAFNAVAWRVYNESSAPSNSVLLARSNSLSADVSAWADWPLTWASGAAVLTDQSGNGRTLTANGTLYQGTQGPLDTGTTYTADVSEAVSVRESGGAGFGGFQAYAFQANAFQVFAANPKSIEIGRTTWGSDNLLCATAPTGGVLFSCWTKAKDPGAAPWSRGNIEMFNLFAANSWALRGIVGNGSATSESVCGYNANSMFMGYNGSSYDWASDFSYAEAGPLPTSDTNGWVWVAWQIVVSSSDIKINQWLKFGMGGTMLGPYSSTVTLAQMRQALIDNAGWTSGQAAAWTPALNATDMVLGSQYDYSNVYVMHAREVGLSTLPSNATLDAIATNGAADTSAWADWELKWSDSADLTDRSGGAGPDLTVASGGTIYQGVDGPPFSEATLYAEDVSETITETEASAIAATRIVATSESETSAEAAVASRITTGSVAESESTTEANVTGTTSTVGVAETVASVEALVAHGMGIVAAAESLGLSESMTAGLALTAAMAETVASGESLAVLFKVIAGLADSLSAGETVTGARATSAALAEGLALSESASGGLAYVVNVNESASAAEVLGAVVAYAPTVVESLGLTEAQSTKLTGSLGLAETISKSEGISGGVLAVLGLAEAVASIEALLAQRLSAVALAEALNLTEAQTAGLALAALLSETVSAGESIAPVMHALQGLADSSSVGDGISTGGSTTYAIALEDGTQLSEQASTAVHVLASLADSATSSEVIGIAARLATALADQLGLTESQGAHVSQTLALAEQITSSAGMAAGLLFAASVAEQLTTMDSVAAHASANASLADNDTVTDAIAVYRSTSTSLTDALGVVESAQTGRTFVIGLTESTTLAEAVIAAQDAIAALNEAIATSEVALTIANHRGTVIYAESFFIDPYAAETFFVDSCAAETFFE